MNSSTNYQITAHQDFCRRERRTTIILVALLVASCALPALVFHSGSRNVREDTHTGTFLRDVLHLQNSTVEDL